MTKPTKSATSDKSEDKPSDKPEAKDTTSDTKSETLKLKKEAAKPDSVASKDIGTGSGADAAAGGGKVKPAESTLVGKSTDGQAAAAPKASAEKPFDSKTSSDSKYSDSKADVSQTRVPSTDDKSKKDTADNSKANTASKTPEERRTEAPKDKPAAATTSTNRPSQNVTVQKTGFWRVVSGGVVAAGLGAAATIWALPNLPAGWLPEGPPQETTIDVEAIKADAVAAAEEAARQIASDAAPAGGAPSEDIQAALDNQEQRIAALEKAVEETASAGAGSASLAATTEQPETSPTPVFDGNLQQVVEQLQSRLETQASQIDELAARPTLDPQAASKVQALAGRIDEVQQNINAAQEETAKLQAAAQESTKRAQAVAAIASLQAALEKGVTPEEARNKLEEVGVEAPEALTKEVPSVENLQAGFGDASRAALRATRSGENAGGNFVTNFLRSQTGARSVEPREGNDPDAILSRANASVEKGDIAAALKEMAALPEAAKNAPTMAEWMSGANAYRDAAAALSDLSATNN